MKNTNNIYLQLSDRLNQIIDLLNISTLWENDSEIFAQMKGLSKIETFTYDSKKEKEEDYLKILNLLGVRINEKDYCWTEGGYSIIKRKEKSL